MAKVAVLVLNYNGKKYLKACFDSLRRQTFKDFDIYLVDNGSTDGSVEFVSREYPEVKIIRFSRNLGFAKAYNKAAELVNHEYIVLLNNDTIVDERWLEELYREIKSDDDVFAVGSKILIYGTDRLHYAGTYILASGGGVNIGLGDIHTKPFYNVRRITGAACGASMIVRRDLFLELKFDEDFFAYFEDLDLSWRAWKRGYKIVYTPKSVVYHVLGATWGRFRNPRKIFLITRNRLYTLIKIRDGALNILKGLIIAMIIDTMRIMKSKDPKITKAITYAYWVVLRKLPQLLRKRKREKLAQKISDSLLERAKMLLGLPGIISVSKKVRNIVL